MPPPLPTTNTLTHPQDLLFIKGLKNENALYVVYDSDVYYEKTVHLWMHEWSLTALTIFWSFFYGFHHNIQNHMVPKEYIHIAVSV